MPKYIYAQNISQNEISELQRFKQRGANEFVRGHIIELSAKGKHPKEISESLGLSVGRVREWLRRFNQKRVAGLLAKKSPGRPRTFPEAARYGIRAIISDSPSEYGIPKSRWTLNDICEIAVKVGLTDSISKEQIRRLFSEINWTYTRAKKWQRSPDPLSFRRPTEE